MTILTKGLKFLTFPFNEQPLKKGAFIVFEGLDGSGKGTQIQLLASRLRQENIKVSCSAEPTQSSTGGLIRDVLAGDIKRSPAELGALFLTDRIHHNINSSNGIKMCLENGITVICDRYYYSSFAYQGTECDLEWLMAANLNCPDIIKPDLCIFLDVPPNECSDRISNNRSSKEIFEKSIDTLKAVRSKFFEVFSLLDKSENIAVLNADTPVSELSDKIYEVVKKIL